MSGGESEAFEVPSLSFQKPSTYPCTGVERGRGGGGLEGGVGMEGITKEMVTFSLHNLGRFRVR